MSHLGFHRVSLVDVACGVAATRDERCAWGRGSSTGRGWAGRAAVRSGPKPVADRSAVFSHGTGFSIAHSISQPVSRWVDPSLAAVSCYRSPGLRSLLTTLLRHLTLRIFAFTLAVPYPHSADASRVAGIGIVFSLRQWTWV